MKPNNLILTFLFLFSSFVSVIAQDNWTAFRGSSSDAHATCSSAPVHWGENEHIRWKTAIDGLGWSSPVVFDGQVWISSATDDGKELFACCFDFNSGKMLRKIMLFKPDSVQYTHPTNSYATPTPCIEDGFAYIHFGTYGTACVDTKNFQVVWTRTDLNCNHMQGAAASPFLYKNLLILHIEGTDVQYLIALDKRTGKTVWKTERPQEFYRDVEPVYRKAYCTPVIIQVDGKDQLISNGAQVCVAYEPETGKPLWQIFYGEDSTVAQPVYYNGLVLVNSGWVVTKEPGHYAQLFAVDPRGLGDITNTNIRWKADQDIPQISTPVLVDSLLFMVHERGTMTCLNPRTGVVVWKEKIKDQFNSSPVVANGHIYFFSLKGNCYVVKADPTFEQVAVNSLDGVVKATPAIVRNNLIVKTDKFLYCISEE